MEGRAAGAGGGAGVEEGGRERIITTRGTRISLSATNETRVGVEGTYCVGLLGSKDMIDLAAMNPSEHQSRGASWQSDRATVPVTPLRSVVRTKF